MNIKIKKIVSTAGILIGYLIFSYSALLIIIDYSNNRSLKTLLISHSFSLTCALLFIGAGIFFIKKTEAVRLRKFIFSFLLISALISLSIISTSFSITAKNQNSLAELPILLMFILPAITIYSLLESTVSIYGQYSYTRIFVFNIFLSIIIAISFSNHFWLFQWLAIGLIADSLFCILKRP